MKSTNLISIFAASAAALLAIATTADAAPLREASAQQSSNPVLHGLHLYQQGDYSGAVAAFQGAVQKKPDDTLAKVWLGLAQVASGNAQDGIATLKFATDTIGAWSAEAAELRALTWWRAGNTDIAKSELGFCMNGKSRTLCQKMEQGIENGQQPPDVSAWPGIVGLVNATQARGTTWMP